MKFIEWRRWSNKNIYSLAGMAEGGEESRRKTNEPTEWKKILTLTRWNSWTWKIIAYATVSVRSSAWVCGSRVCSLFLRFFPRISSLTYSFWNSTVSLQISSHLSVFVKYKYTKTCSPFFISRMPFKWFFFSADWVKWRRTNPKRMKKKKKTIQLVAGIFVPNFGISDLQWLSNGSPFQYRRSFVRFTFSNFRKFIIWLKPFFSLPSFSVLILALFVSVSNLFERNAVNVPSSMKRCAFHAS